MRDSAGVFVAGTIARRVVERIGAGVAALVERVGGAVAALVVAVVASIGVIVAMPAGPVAAETFTDDEAVELAERHAPVIMVVTQDEECSDDGEAYRPLAVTALLDNPQIALRQVGTADPVVMWGPGAADLYGSGGGFYLDSPGLALSPGCLYEQDGRRFAGDLPPTIYAHVVSQDDRPGQLVVEYWFFWYYNDWNNKHEGDWEGIQVVFDADDPAAALLTSPASVGYAQHEGGERADWDDAKLERDGPRPVVYASRGSHASYFAAELYLGRSASEGFGCDDTTGPSTRVDPTVEVVPAAASGPDDPFAWLGFDGAWGERHSGPFGGPTGPAAKDRWERPLDWHDELRSASVEVPAPGSLSGDLVDGFCGLVGAGSNVLLDFTRAPGRTLAIIGVVVAIGTLLARRTDWSGSAPTPIVARRALGQIMRASAGLIRMAPLAFLRIGVVAAAFVLPVTVLAGLAAQLPVVRRLVQVDATGTSSFLALAAGAGTLLGVVFEGAAAARTATAVAAGDAPSPFELYRAVRGRALVLLGALAAAGVVVGGLTALVVLSPIALYLVVRLALLAPVSMLEQPEGVAATLRRALQLSRRRWWKTAATALVAFGAVALFTSALALAVLVLVQPPFWLLTTLVVVLQIALAPLASVPLVYLYGDALASADDDAADAVGSAPSPPSVTPVPRPSH